MYMGGKILVAFNNVIEPTTMIFIMFVCAFVQANLRNGLTDLIAVFTNVFWEALMLGPHYREMPLIIASRDVNRRCSHDLTR